MKPAPEQDPDYHWWSGWCECSICGSHWVVTIEIPKECNEPFVAIECYACGNFTASPADPP